MTATGNAAEPTRQPSALGDPISDPLAREAILRQVLAQSRINMWAIRADGTLLFFFGRSPSTDWKPGANLFEYYSQVMPDVRERFARAVAGERTTSVNVHGDTFVESWYLPMIAGPGQPSSGIVGVSIDITERAQMEQALRDSEAHYRTIMDQASEGIFVTDARGKVIDANRRGCEMFGYTRDEVLAMRPEQFHAPEEMAVNPLRRDRIIAGDTLVSDRTGVRKDGTRFPTRSSTKLVAGKYVMAIVSDISAEALAADALRESTERARVLASATTDAVVVLANGKVIDANAAAARLFGTDGLVGRDLKSCVVPASAEVLASAIDPAGNTVRTATIVLASGAEIVTEVRAHALTVGGRPAQVAVFRDITAQVHAAAERTRFDDRMRQAQKLESLGVLAGGIAHDFNNLLHAILGHAELAQMEVGTNARAAESLQHIETAARRAARLTEQMLAYSGRGRYELELVDLRGVVGEMTGLLGASLSRKITISTREASRPVNVVGDPGQMRQILMNLVTNAADAIGAKSGTIAVNTGVMHARRAELDVMELGDGLAEGDYAFVEVADDGSGMTPETRRRIFEPFYTTKFTGRGLGLAAVLGIVRSHHGAISVVSTAEGPRHGTRMRVLLPLASDGTPVPTPAPIVRALERRGTVLVADDEDAVRQVVRASLQRAGFAVIEAHDGRSAVEVYRRQHAEIDLVLLDLTMPRLSGDDALRELRSINPAVTVLLMSGYGAGLPAPVAAEPFIQKPFRRADLLDRVDALIGRQ